MMKDAILMNTKIIRQRAYHMDRDENDPIGTDPQMKIVDEDEANDGYVVYTEDEYNFTHPEDRADMFDRMLWGIYHRHNNAPESLDAFLEEAKEAVERFRANLKKP